jgi:hypothetical protein
MRMFFLGFSEKSMAANCDSPWQNAVSIIESERFAENF